MSVRRWVSIAGMVVAVVGGTAAAARGAAGPEFEAQLEMTLGLTRLPPPVRDGQVRLLTREDDDPEATELVK